MLCSKKGRSRSAEMLPHVHRHAVTVIKSHGYLPKTIGKMLASSPKCYTLHLADIHAPIARQVPRVAVAVVLRLLFFETALVVLGVIVVIRFQ